MATTTTVSHARDRPRGRAKPSKASTTSAAVGRACGSRARQRAINDDSARGTVDGSGLGASV
jgi:hypothetical protein